MPTAKKAVKKKASKAITPKELQKAINKQFGEGTMKMASDPDLVIERIPTGILSVDFITSGGLPRGRHIELFGSANAGKTYTALRFIAEAQRRGLRAAFVDVEKSFDPLFAEHAGVDLSKLAFHHQKHGNQVVDFIETLLRSKLYDVIVLDSIAALLPKSELENDMEAGSYGAEQAKLMSKALRKLTTANEKTVLVYINQTREAIGVMFGKRTRTSGGVAMWFYAGTRIEMVKTESIKRSARQIDPSNGSEKVSDIVVGHRVLVRIEKDKTGGSRPYEQTSFTFNYEKSEIDHLEDLIYLGRVTGLIHKTGDKWWVDGYEDEKQHGRPRFKKWLRRNRAVAEELEEMIREAATGKEESEEAAEAEG